jgi:23S rRNA (cytosine1962-C5)-methyltransferase
MNKIILKPKRSAAVKRFHPWVFSGAIASIEEGTRDGDTVEVYDHKDQYLATGHYQKGGSISVRIFSFVETTVDQAFWNKKIHAAYQYRKSIGLSNKPHTNCYRLMHAEGDGVPGLIIDIYGDVAVIQCHSIGMHKALAFITHALQQLPDQAVKVIFDKSKDTLPNQYARTINAQYTWGEASSTTVIENGHTFKVDWEQGQKTGFFLDQRDNRALLAQYCKDKKVLNSFCYSGGFSIYALKAGARFVDSVDISATAIQLTDENVQLNGFDNSKHQSYAEDVLQFLKTADDDYEVMVVDPPAFAKSLKKRHNAVQGYKRLNALALRKIRPGGIYFTFSCSQVVGRQLFHDTIVAAALEANRKIRVMHQLYQPADHPVNIFHPEGNYLKGLVLWVE